MSARKDDKAKPRMELIPMDALVDVAWVLTKGAFKYGDRNWEQGLAYSRLYGATLRHLAEFSLGHERDPESGELHLAHAACSLLMLLSTVLRDSVGDLDDRFCNTTAVKTASTEEEMK